MKNNSLKVSTNSTSHEISSQSPKGSPNSTTSSNKINDPGEWLIWCQENKVLKQNVDLVHYEFETCRRHFNTLKFNPKDEGVHPKTLADSFFRAELFPTFNEALQYCNKLRNDENLITYSDLLEATQCKFSYKRNKARSYVKFVASSDIFLKALHAHEAEALASPTNNSANAPLVNSTSTVEVYNHPDGKFERTTTRRLDTVSEFSTTRQANPTIDSLPQDEGLASEQGDSQRQPHRQPPKRLDSRTLIAGTIENGRKALVRLYSNASEMINGILERGGTNPTHEHPIRSHPRRQESRESGGGIRNFFSRTYSRVPSFAEHDHVAHHPPVIVESGLRTEDQESPAHNSKKPTLKKYESGEAITVPVRPKRATMTVYTHGHMLHTFPGRNSRIAAEDFDAN